MAQYIVRPTSVVRNGGGTNPSTQATVLTNIGDNSDLTTVIHNTTSPIYWRFGLGAPTIPSDEFVCRIGHVIRWSGGGNTGSGAANVGVITYRSTDTAPTAYPTLSTTGTGVATTTEVAYSAVNWSLTDVASLRLAWYDGRSSSAQLTVTTYDIWSNIYTLKNATTSVSNQSSSASYPTIAVSTTATIDWEASTYDWQNLRKIRTYVQIESGGSGVNTGTIVAAGYTDTIFTATGTNSINVTLGTAIANGTYNIYSRAGRFREDGSISNDTYGAWSTVATLTQSVSAPSTPSLVVTWSATTQRVTLVANGSSYSSGSQTWQIQRSNDSGVTWTDVRGLSAVNSTAATIPPNSFTGYDYEASRTVSVLYRIRSNGLAAGFTLASAWSTSYSVTPTYTTWNLKVPENATLNIVDIKIIDKPTEDLVEEMGIFRPLGSRYPVIVSGTLGGWDGEIQIITATSAEWTALKSVLESQKVLLLESPFGWAKYIRIIGGAKAALLGSSTAPRRQISASYVEVAAP